MARLKPRARINFQFPAELKKFRVKFSNNSGGIGNAWDSGPHYYSTEDPEVEIQKNVTLIYHVRVRLADHEIGGVAIENMYLVTEKGWENMCQWPYEEIMAYEPCKRLKILLSSVGRPDVSTIGSGSFLAIHRIQRIETESGPRLRRTGRKNG